MSRDVIALVKGAVFLLALGGILGFFYLVDTFGEASASAWLLSLAGIGGVFAVVFLVVSYLRRQTIALEKMARDKEQERERR